MIYGRQVLFLVWHPSVQWEVSDGVKRGVLLVTVGRSLWNAGGQGTKQVR